MEDEGLLHWKLATYTKKCQKCGIYESTGSQNCKFHASFLRVSIPKELIDWVCWKNEEGLKQIERASDIRIKLYPEVKKNKSEFWLQGNTQNVKRAFRMIQKRLKNNKGRANGTWNCCGRSVRGKGCTEDKSHIFLSQPLGKVFALDCEMVKTSAGTEIARVALLDFSGEICIDKFVKPQNEVLDYGTKYSGITEDKLRGIKTRLSDVKKSLNRLVSDNDILVGHSIAHDLKGLHWRHEKVEKKINTKLISCLRLPIPAMPFQTLTEAKTHRP